MRDQVLVHVGVDAGDSCCDIGLERAQQRAFDGEVPGNLRAGELERLEHRFGAQRVGAIVLDLIAREQMTEARANAEKLLGIDSVPGLPREVVDDHLLFDRRVVDERQLVEAGLARPAGDGRSADRNPAVVDLDEVAVECGGDLAAVALHLRHRLEQHLLLGARGRSLGGGEEIVLHFVERLGDDVTELRAGHVPALAEQRLALRRLAGAAVHGRYDRPHGRFHDKSLLEPHRAPASEDRSRESSRGSTSRWSSSGSEIERLYPGVPAEDAKPPARCCLCCYSWCGDYATAVCRRHARS